MTADSQSWRHVFAAEDGGLRVPDDGECWEINGMGFSATFVITDDGAYCIVLDDCMEGVCVLGDGVAAVTLDTLLAGVEKMCALAYGTRGASDVQRIRSDGRSSLAVTVTKPARAIGADIGDMVRITLRKEKRG